MSDLAGLIVFKSAGSGDHGFAVAEDAAAPQHCSIDYLRARERAERAAAKRAQSLAARQVHQELAQQYAEFLRTSS
jgi:hypothetical protein